MAQVRGGPRRRGRPPPAARRGTAGSGGPQRPGRSDAEDAGSGGAGPGGARPSPWGRRVLTGLLTAGAAASAVTALVALWPDRDPVDKVSITETYVQFPFPLSQYRATVSATPRGTPAGAQEGPVLRQLRLDQVGDGPTSQDATSEDPTSQESTSQESTSQESTAQDATRGDPTSPGSTSGDPTSPDPAAEETTPADPDTTVPPTDSSSSETPGSDAPGAGRAREHLADPSALERTYDDVVDDPALDDYELPPPVLVPPTGTPSTGAASLLPSLFIIGDLAVDARGQPVPPEVIAERLAARLQHVRTQERAGKLDPVGIRATIDLEVQGLRGERLLVHWRLLPEPTAAPLPEDWWGSTLAQRLHPATDLDTVSFDLWVPVPVGAGPYVLDVLVTHEETGRTFDSTRSTPFAAAD